ncbi:MAG: phage holin family protein [Acidimicrobiia bacterium]|nr:phage holin family protein [Acidimicrobiia bacterium]
MEDFARRIPDLLESITERIRAMTVDRAAKVITVLALGLVAMTLVTMALIFLFVGIFRIADEVTYKICDCTSSMEIAYAIVGGLFLLVGALLWARRKPPQNEPVQESTE